MPLKFAIGLTSQHSNMFKSMHGQYRKKKPSHLITAPDPANKYEKGNKKRPGLVVLEWFSENPRGSARKLHYNRERDKNIEID
jgi:hypothetical protein